MNLLALHLHAPTGGQPTGCTCTRAICGGSEQGHDNPTHCTAHGTVNVFSHRAFDCPALPADTDLSRLHILITKWTPSGPKVLRAYPFDRVLLADLRDGDSPILWDVSEGDTDTEAINAWRARLHAMRAAHERQTAAYVAAARARAERRQMAVDALRDSTRRAARRTYTALDFI